MALPQIGTRAEPQIIPTNAGLRTFAAPPSALQENIVPNDLFYVRNHWKDCPEIDVDTYRLKVNGQVERELSLSLDDLKSLPQKRFQVTFECCGNSPVPEYYTKALRISSVMEQIKGHGIMGNAEWTGVSLRDVLELAGVKDNAVEVMFEGADHGPDEVVGDPAEVKYERSLPMAKAMHPDTLLAYEMNGEPLPLMHGRPPAPAGFGLVRHELGQVAGRHTRSGPRVQWLLHDRALHDPERARFAHSLHLLHQAQGQVHHHQPGPRRDHSVSGYQLAGAAWSGEQQIEKVEFSEDAGENCDGCLWTWCIRVLATPGTAGSITGDRPVRVSTRSCAAPPTIWEKPSLWSSPTSGMAGATGTTWSSPSKWRSGADPHTQHASAIRFRSGGDSYGGADHILRGLGSFRQ